MGQAINCHGIASQNRDRDGRSQNFSLGEGAQRRENPGAESATEWSRRRRRGRGVVYGEGYPLSPLGVRSGGCASFPEIFNFSIKMVDSG